MKTTILRLDPHDDLVSTRDKMGWAKSGRILLVWPERRRVPSLRRELDLLLLLRHSQSLGAQLALVTKDPLVRDHAKTLGIPLFGSLRQAQNAAWHPGESAHGGADRELNPPSLRRDSAVDLGPPDLRSLGMGLSRTPASSWRDIPAVRLLFTALALAAILGLAAIVLPRATITLVPDSQVQEISVPLALDPDLETFSLTGTLPAEILEVEVEGHLERPTRGRMSLPDGFAEGEALFTNLTIDALAIPSGTIVQSRLDPSIRFATTRVGSLPAGIGQAVNLPVRALEPGPGSNLGADSLGAIEGAIGTRLSVTNMKELSGGSTVSLPAPLPIDRVQLQEALESQLRQTAWQELSMQVQSGDLIANTTLTLTQVLEEEFIPASESPADVLQLNLRLEYQALAARKAAQQALAEQIMDMSLPTGFTSREGSLQVTAVQQPNSTWVLEASRRIEAQLPPRQAALLALGLRPQQAAQRLRQTLQLAEPPVVQVIPGWWPWLPLLPARIEIRSESANPGS